MSANEKPGSGSQLLIDVGPLLVFFAANFFAPVPPALKIFVATGAFMAAMVAAMIYSALRFGRISPMLWFSGVLVVVMGEMPPETAQSIAEAIRRARELGIVP